MIKYIVTAWISGVIAYQGHITEDQYLVAITENVFDTRVACESYMHTEQDKWFGKLSQDAVENNSDWVGITLNEDPECIPYNTETQESYDENTGI